MNVDEASLGALEVGGGFTMPQLLLTLDTELFEKCAEAVYAACPRRQTTHLYIRKRRIPWGNGGTVALTLVVTDVESFNHGGNVAAVILLIDGGLLLGYDYATGEVPEAPSPEDDREYSIGQGFNPSSWWAWWASLPA